MINGISFQPGSLDERQDELHRRQGTAQGVQEAIRVLSLRLPKVVGAQALAPSALLASPGADGNRGVDSLVEKVLSKIFPTRQAQAPAAPMIPVGGDRTGNYSPEQPSSPHRAPASIDRYDPDAYRPVPPAPPRIVPGNDVTPPPPPQNTSPVPDLRKDLDWLPAPDGVFPRNREL